MYKVIAKFADLKDNKHLYHPGDKYPRDGAETDEERIAELSTTNNALRQPLIKEVVEKPLTEEVKVKRTRKKNAD